MAEQPSKSGLPAPSGEVQRPHRLISQRVLKASSDKAAIELLGDLAAHLFPGVTDISQLDPPDRSRWILLQQSVLQNQQATRGLSDRMVETIGELVEVETSQALTLAEQTSREQRERHLQGLREQDDRFRQELLEQRQIHEQELRERRARHELELQEARERLGAAQVETRMPPPPPSPVYTSLFGNQLRWASHVIRYALQERRLRTKKGISPKSN